MFKLINGIYYSEHDLDLDHDTIKQEVLDSRDNPEESSHFSRPHQYDVDMQHTFYEDTNLYDKTFATMQKSVDKVLYNIFGPDRFEAEEIWGHIIPPGEQTMVHNHSYPFRDGLGLSWVYYPHAPKDSGNLHFMVNVDGNTTFTETTMKKGKLFLFSNYIMHFTPRNASKVDRVSISGNYYATEVLKSELGVDEEFTHPYWKYSGKI